ncbi:MAG: hypothetical protein HC862_18945 [Scytonema sp. RU_4_4]|nr:hypothetical protein [Scytonema sp. RU_4_4]
MLRQDVSVRQSNIKRKHLIYSLFTGLILGIFAGTPLGWIAHQYYYQHSLAQTLLCREQNKNQPVAVVDSICGRAF